MKIVVDASPLLLRSAGVKSVLYYWIQALREAAGSDAIRTFPPMSRIASLDHERSVASAWETYSGLAMVVANLRLSLPFPGLFARGADIYHATNQTRVPPSGVKLTATVHDLTCWKMPELHTAANVQADRRYAREILSRAAGLIAVSEHSRQDAIDMLRVDPSRIVTIYNGVAETYFRAGETQPNPPRIPYVLCVGTIEPRKNIDRLLDAWRILRNDLRDQYELLIVGPAGWASEMTIARLHAKPEGVRWLGYVPEEDLPALTRNATLLAYPSLYEGFGLPLAQAMACGVPAVTSNTSCLPEVAGEAARTVDPHSTEELAHAIEALLDDPDERARRGAAGRQRACELFHWAAAAELSLQFFEQVLRR